MYETRDSLLKRAERTYAEVEVDGGTVRIQSLDAGEFLRIEPLLQQNGKPNSDRLGEMFALLQYLAVVDEAGNRVFRETDIELLRHQSATVALPLVMAIQRHIGLADTESKNSPEAEPSPAG